MFLETRPATSVHKSSPERGDRALALVRGLPRVGYVGKSSQLTEGGGRLTRHSVVATEVAASTGIDPSVSVTQFGVADAPGTVPGGMGPRSEPGGGS